MELECSKFVIDSQIIQTINNRIFIYSSHYYDMFGRYLWPSSAVF